MKDECSSIMKPLQDDVKNLKTELNTTKAKLASANTQISELTSKLQNLCTECEKEKKVSNDSLKYLTNRDRNIRRNNLIVLGITETNVFKINEHEFHTDEEVMDFIFEEIGISDDVVITEMFRLGRKPVEIEGDEDGAEQNTRHRPIKVRLSDKSMVEKALKNSYQLKEKFGDNVKMHFKPDKSKAEREEYSRLGREKVKLLEQYPTEEGQLPKVVFKKGKLLLNGAQVDQYRSAQSLF